MTNKFFIVWRAFLREMTPNRHENDYGNIYSSSLNSFFGPDALQPGAEKPPWQKIDGIVRGHDGKRYHMTGYYRGEIPLRDEDGNVI